MLFLFSRYYATAAALTVISQALRPVLRFSCTPSVVNLQFVCAVYTRAPADFFNFHFSATAFSCVRWLCYINCTCCAASSFAQMYLSCVRLSSGISAVSFSGCLSRPLSDIPCSGPCTDVCANLMHLSSSSAYSFACSISRAFSRSLALRVPAVFTCRHSSDAGFR